MANRRTAIPYRFLGAVLRVTLLVSAALALLGYWNKDRLPPAPFYGGAELAEPRQTPTGAGPFFREVAGVRFRVDPVADYELDGVVVSLHDTDAFWDIYHRDWQDRLNIRDLCVIWGANVASGVYLDMGFENTAWTCWASWPSREVGERFAMEALSNNHLLADDPAVARAIRSARPGDRVRLRGVLAEYSHDGGFRRGTSTSRSDTGNGACETVYVRDFRVVQEANPGWRRVYAVARTLALASLAGLVAILFLAPVRVGPRRR